MNSNSHLNYGRLEYPQPTMDVVYGTETVVTSYQGELDPFCASQSARYGIPYLDHSYAADLPTLPDDQATVQHILVPDQLGAFIDIEDVSCNTTVVTAPSREKNDSSSSGDPYEGSITRCICDFQHDDGFMISCDRCGVWQHVDCMGVDRRNIPENYLCELCYPRFVDKRRAVRLQTRKREDMVDSATESSGEEELPPTSRRGRPRRDWTAARKRQDFDTLPSSASASYTSSSYGIPGKRARSRTTSELTDDKSEFSMQNHKGPGTPKRQRRQSSGDGMFKRRNTMNDAERHVTIDHSLEDVCLNTYTDDVLGVLASHRQSLASGHAQSMPANPSLLKEQILKSRFRVADLGSGSKGVLATEPIKVNQAIAEYTGNVMTKDEYIHGSSFDTSYPLILCYSGLEGYDFCIDSRHWDNDIRYIRCSCMANAKVVHITEHNTIRFFVCAIKNIAEGREITIPYHFDYQQSNVDVMCPCGRASCVVARFYRSKHSSRPIRVGRPRSQPNITIVEGKVKPDSTAATIATNNPAESTTLAVTPRRRGRAPSRTEPIKSCATTVGNPDVVENNAIVQQMSSAITSPTLPSSMQPAEPSASAMSISGQAVVSNDVQSFNSGTTLSVTDLESEESSDLLVIVENNSEMPETDSNKMEENGKTAENDETKSPTGESNSSTLSAANDIGRASTRKRLRDRPQQLSA